MSEYKEGDFIWSCYDGEWFEAEVEEAEEGGTYRVYYHEYDDSVPDQPLHLIKDYEEGETEPPPDGSNQEGAEEGDGELEVNEEEEETNEEEEEEEEERVAVTQAGAAVEAQKRAARRFGATAAKGRLFLWSWRCPCWCCWRWCSGSW
mmetsp:Transcript_22886/g.45430  ORF Transcript_22886/g.45430 Transcript_22886/m.45430 type:complete len:148 (+) Transcript_22886:81-524(+)